MLSGTVRSAAVAEDARRLAVQQVNGNPNKVISNIRVDAPTQVQLRVKVAEVKRDALKRVGINWQNINNIALFGTGNFLAASPSGPPRRSAAPSRPAPCSSRPATAASTRVVDFLATQNQATILAEPNLIAMSGETASFLAGGEVPLIVPQSGAAAGTVTIQYKQVGVSLAFTPTIIGERINLSVAPEVSELSAVGTITVPLGTGTVIDPGIRTRKASTTIELGSGQSFAIAGLLQSTSQQDINKFPWIGDIPVLGTLFKSDAYQRSETELVIIITPYFVEPTSNKLQTPLTGRVPPTDVDRLVMQRYNHPTPPRRLAVGREPTRGRPDRRLQTGLGAAMRSVVVLLAAALPWRPAHRTRSPSRPRSTRATTRCAPTPWSPSTSRPSAGGPDGGQVERAQDHGRDRPAGAARRVRRRVGRNRRADAAGARPARRPGAVQCRRALGLARRSSRPWRWAPTPWSWCARST